MDIKYPHKTPGIVKAIQAAEGDTVTVGQAFAVVEENADAAAAKPAAEEAAPEPEAPKQEAAAAPPPPKPAAKPAAEKPAPPPPPPKPAAAEKPAAAAAPAAPPAPGSRPERRVPMTRLRRRISERLKGAQNTYAMLSTFNEVDMTNVMEMRRELKVGWGGQGGPWRCKLRSWAHVRRCSPPATSPAPPPSLPP
jgi:2-oxoglutarate dehydrogenase E2 component (dihydrolipoamide succinyltransferase)